MTSQGEQFAELTCCKCEFCYTRPLFRLRNARISSLVPCLNVEVMFDAATREMIAIDGFRVANATKRSSKKTSERLRAQFRRLPEIQRRPEWRRFIDGYPHDRRFPVVIATKRSSRTLLDSRPLEVCA